MSKYYIGLWVTYHNRALAIVDEQGKVLFAEATERYLQDKRALNCAPDQLFQIPELLQRYCADAHKIVNAINWRKNVPFMNP
ncbi:MAG: hypothetical protein ACXW0Q_15290 [Methylovulum sp.]